MLLVMLCSFCLFFLFWFCLFFLYWFCLLAESLMENLSDRDAIFFKWCSALVQTFHLVACSISSSASIIQSGDLVVSMIVRQWFVIHMPAELWGLRREGMFWLGCVAEVQDFMLSVKNKKIHLVTQAAWSYETAVSVLEKTLMAKWLRTRAVKAL